MEFTLNGVRERLRPAMVLATVVRWVMNGKYFAYSYGLVPVSGHRTTDKWATDSEAGCVYTSTFVDD